jgi:hypothetical protein
VSKKSNKFTGSKMSPASVSKTMPHPSSPVKSRRVALLSEEVQPAASKATAPAHATARGKTVFIVHEEREIAQYLSPHTASNG